MLARNIDRGVADSDEAEDRGDLKNLAGSAGLHVPDGLLREVDQGDHVDLDDLADCLGILGVELGVVAHAGVVDEQVDTSRHGFGLVPERLPEGGVGEVAATDLNSSGGKLRGQRLEPVAPSRRGENGHSAVPDELADEFPSDSRRRAGDEGVSAWRHGFGLHGLFDSRRTL